ncbi:MAG: hypothetical protein ACYC8T_13900 [Myxococcaceae bacterium]
MRPPRGHRQARWAALLALLLTGCPAPAPAPDAGGVVLEDAGPPPPCDSPAACKMAGFDGVCRAGTCRSGVPCTDDVECGLAERCAGGRCRFEGCIADSECGTGKCLADVFACAECAASSDCPAGRPVCNPLKGSCFQCKADADCQGVGPAYCDTAKGACAYCRSSDHCPNGLSCGPDGICHGALKNAPCPLGVSCDLGLMCVTLNNSPVCLTPCSLYTPVCPAGQLCLKLTFSGTNSLVFDKGEPLGICYEPFSGLKYYREVCTRSATAQNCQPNLECVPDGPNNSVCRSFCNPNASGTCPPGELCHPFPGDYDDHRYGLCYPDNGWGEPCSSDSKCRAGLACTPGDDPSAPESMSTFCHFKVGTAPALSPCVGVSSPDGGVVPPDGVCASGACRGDLAFSPANFFCYGACGTDADCAVGGRLGTCDGTFAFTGSNVSADLTGCRPRCEARADCAQYGAQFTCRTRLEVTYYVPKLVQACGPTQGAGLLGAPCVVNADCREGLCTTSDARGVLRAGSCSQPCAVAADCTSADGGFAPGCESVSLLGSNGYDNLPNTSDDRHVATRQCAGGACTSDGDCGGGTLCAPEVSPASPLSTLSLRCLSPSRAGVKAGGEACSVDSECQSGACAILVPPSTGTGRVCLMPCGPSTVCPGVSSCHTGGAVLATPNGSLQSFTACTP